MTQVVKTAAMSKLFKLAFQGAVSTKYSCINVALVNAYAKTLISKE